MLVCDKCGGEIETLEGCLILRISDEAKMRLTIGSLKYAECDGLIDDGFVAVLCNHCRRSLSKVLKDFVTKK